MLMILLLLHPHYMLSTCTQFATSHSLVFNASTYNSTYHVFMLSIHPLWLTILSSVFCAPWSYTEYESLCTYVGSVASCHVEIL